MIVLRDLSKSFGPVNAVRGVSLQIGRAEVVGLLGANGAGKTTTIRMITGFLPPDAGSVHVGAHDMVEDSRAARRQIGYLPEAAPAYSEMAVSDFLHFRGRLYGLGHRERTAAVGRSLARCWLQDVSHRRIGHLSKGFRQRVGLAAALLHDPRVVVLDEPTNGLDPTQIRQMRTLIRELGADRTVLVSSHILPEVERTCDRVVIMSRGRIAADARPADLLQALLSASDYVVELRPGPGGVSAAATALGRIEGVAKVTPQAAENAGWASLAITPAPGAPDLREALAATAAAGSLAVRELRRETPSLERVFMELIESDNAGGLSLTAGAPAA
jgi:ABC-2 type transport system ATP-binding protein